MSFCAEYANKNPEYGYYFNNSSQFANAIWKEFSNK